LAEKEALTSLVRNSKTLIPWSWQVLPTVSKRAGKLHTNLGLGTETDFPPLHGRTDGPFGNIIGGLNSFIFKEGEKVLPVVKKPLCSCLDFWVGAVAENNTEIVHLFPHG
jgi:hypothetical protein